MLYIVIELHDDIGPFDEFAADSLFQDDCYIHIYIYIGCAFCACLLASFLVCLFVCWLVGWLFCLFACLLVCWFVGLLVGWLVGLFVCLLLCVVFVCFCVFVFVRCLVWFGLIWFVFWHLSG